MTRVLVTGGTRSGKSGHAEALLAGRRSVTYVATGPQADDEAWAERLRAHRERRPRHWRTVETTDLSALRGDDPVLLDSLGTWVTAQLDDLGAWDSEGWHGEWRRRRDEAVTALSAIEDLVVVTEEVGLGGVGAHASARLFADLLGDLNQQVAATCDEVHLVVAGRVLRL